MRHIFVSFFIFISVFACSQDFCIGLGFNNTGTKPFPDVLRTRYGINGIIEYQPENLRLGTSVNPSLQFADDDVFMSLPIEVKWTFGELNM